LILSAKHNSAMNKAMGKGESIISVLYVLHVASLRTRWCQTVEILLETYWLGFCNCIYVCIPLPTCFHTFHCMSKLTFKQSMWAIPPSPSHYAPDFVYSLLLHEDNCLTPPRSKKSKSVYARTAVQVLTQCGSNPWMYFALNSVRGQFE